MNLQTARQEGMAGESLGGRRRSLAGILSCRLQAQGDLIGASFQRSGSLPASGGHCSSWLSRCVPTGGSPATRFFQPTDREDAGISASDRGCLKIPTLYEPDRDTSIRSTLARWTAAVPGGSLREAFPRASLSGMVARLMRGECAVAVQTLEQAAAKGACPYLCGLSPAFANARLPACLLD